MKVLDLFSGIGGFSLGLEAAGMETIAFCEKEPFCRKVLAKHWPKVSCHTDITTLDGKQYHGQIQVICGGFPCQDLSQMGKRKGLSGERSGLWKHYARIIGEVRPRYVIVENVTALLDRGMGEVLSDLAQIGYDAEWECIPASAIGAPQERDRIWIIAYPMSHAEGAGWFRRLQEVKKDHWPRLVLPVGSGMADGIPNWIHRTGALGNAIVPKIAEILGKAIMEFEHAR